MPLWLDILGTVSVFCVIAVIFYRPCMGKFSFKDEPAITGGVITTNGGYIYHTFTNTGEIFIHRPIRAQVFSINGEIKSIAYKEGTR